MGLLRVKKPPIIQGICKNASTSSFVAFFKVKTIMCPKSAITLSRSARLLAVVSGLFWLQACGSSNGGSEEPGETTVPVVAVAEPVTDDTGNGLNPPDNDVVLTIGDLAPLPTVPLTPAPGPDSEPVQAEANTTTITQFSALRDPARELVDELDKLTDADFAAGPLPAEISIPAGLDPSSNSPPYFADLNNAEVFAGEQLRVLYDPDDQDGGLPGMFPHSLPEGATFVDNFDGTKSLHWSPLQPDVGIHEFTVTATDPEVPLYRSTQTIRIKVALPGDTSGIRNLPPGINAVRPSTATVGDPIVAYLKVTDPNDTIPTLRVLNPPPGSTMSPHPSEAGITILHFVPDAPGMITLNLRAIDAEDTSLTFDSSVNIEVMSESDDTRPGTRLRELASARDLLFGYAALQSFYERPDGAIYARIAGEEFNIVSTENSLKFDFINPLPGKFRWAATDNLVQLAKAQQQTVHGHTLVWYTQLPPWVIRSALADRELIMREFIDRVLKRYADDIQLWDVVNESLEEDGTLRRSVWFEGMGADYIDIAFRQARQSAPDATLIYNDYDIAFAGPKSTGMLNLMRQLKDASTPIDGVGFQLHLFADFNKFDEVAETFQKIADMDLDVYVTELDVSIGDGQTEAQQAEVYEQILSACLAQSRCKAFQIWGFTDTYTWRDGLNPLILDERYQVKPAYLALQKRLTEN